MFLTDEIIFCVRKYILWLLKQVKKTKIACLYFMYDWKLKTIINVIKLCQNLF